MGQGERRRAPLMGPSFWLGLGSGGALGGALLVLALVTPPEPMQARQVLGDAGAAGGAAQSAPYAAAVAAQAAAPTQAIFNVRLSRGDGGAAPLPLRVLGVESPESVEVLLRDVPAAARLSRGERREDGTWALRLADLEELSLTLREGMPEAFDLTVEVATPDGAPVARAMAHVRVAGPHEAARSPAPPATAVATGREPSRQPAAALASGSSAVVKPFRTEVTALVQADEPIHRSTPRPPLPQGISTLGGPTGETGDPAAIAPQPTQGRTVWWRLPPPEWTPVQEWTPFKDGASNY